MKDARGRIIYVGKAKRLRNRLASYARQEPDPTWTATRWPRWWPRSPTWSTWHPEREGALLLENTLIKRHRPHYNVDLRDDKNFLLFRLDLKDDFPRLSLVRRAQDDGARYFGPFDRAGAARQTLRLLQRIFPLRRCSDTVFSHRDRPCLDHGTGLCLAPCVGRISREDYRALARDLERFFAGQGMEVAEELSPGCRRPAPPRNTSGGVLRYRHQALSRTLERQHVARWRGTT